MRGAVMAPLDLDDDHIATIGLNELPTAMRTALEQDEVLDVTDQGIVVARIVPVPSARPVRTGLAADLATLDDLATHIGASWKSNLSAPEAVSEQRR
jgi:hypothetical protein